MRTLLQLLLIFLMCLAASWGLSFYTRSLPATISGIVIDWNTSRPAPYTDVRLDNSISLRSWPVPMRAGGSASVRPGGPGPYFLFAGPPRYGTLLPVVPNPLWAFTGLEKKS